MRRCVPAPLELSSLSSPSPARLLEHEELTLPPLLPLQLRKFRAFCTVEMLRVTWEKQSNPYIKFATRPHRPPVGVQRKLFLARPKGSRYRCVSPCVLLVRRCSAGTPSGSATARRCRLTRLALAVRSKPITLHLYYAGTDLDLASAHELVMDIPGGGFICMTPEHHAERLLRWAKQLGPTKAVVSFNYGKVRRLSLPYAFTPSLDAGERFL